ncbi:MAG: S24 family peptidase [Desulfuromonadaceae bacterium]
MNTEVDKAGPVFDLAWDRVCKLTGWKTYGDLAEYLDIKPPSVSGAKKRGVMPLEWLFKIAQGYDASTDWLATGEGETKRGKVVYPLAEGLKTTDFGGELGQGFVQIPLYDVHAAAGAGAIVEHENIIDFLYFKSEWVRFSLNASPQDLYLIHVEGESMEPTLRPGDVILVDHRTADTLPRDGIYVLRMDDTLLVKRLQRLPGNIIKVTSDNSAYDPFTISLGDPMAGVAIIGRVVWCGRRM